jgi:hypothetical protein
MTKNDRIILLYFFAKTPMYIGEQVDQRTMMSFLHGYEMGRKNKCKFLETAKDLLIQKYKVSYPSTGIVGQIDKLSKKRKLSWVVTFKQLALEVILLNGTRTVIPELKKIMRSLIQFQIEMINVVNTRPFLERWIDQWNNIADTKNEWLEKIMTPKELEGIYEIAEEVNAFEISNSL